MQCTRSDSAGLSGLLIIYLEVWLQVGEGIGNEYLFGHTAGSAETNKNYIRKSMEEIWRDPRFYSDYSMAFGVPQQFQIPNNKSSTVRVVLEG
jgi:hypothetical protein